nr:Nephrocystin-3-like protein 3 [Colletotrichum truncatum]KAF6786685.1 Nephrocystin-3-like protein 3 [Colletotrichum truncatum]
MSSRPRSHLDFHVALICALPLELDAAVLALDEIWDEREVDFRSASGDYNSYTLGRMGHHNVVLVLLPNKGKASAASAANSLGLNFGALKLALLCGVCGGVPRPTSDAEIVLGDIIISESIVQYDFGRQYSSQFVQKNKINDVFGRPKKEIRSLLSYLKTDHARNDLHQEIFTTMSLFQQKAIDNGRLSKYAYPGDEEDILFPANYLHKHRHLSGCSCSLEKVCDVATNASCAELNCDSSAHKSQRRVTIQQQRNLGSRETTPNAALPQPRVFVGQVGSGDTVMKSGEHRDRMAQEHGIIAFEMEGAGVWDEIPSIIVKGVCDYADSHKNKKWQGFAAAAAASAAKALLRHFPSTPPTEQADSQRMPNSRTTNVSHPMFLVPYTRNSNFIDRSHILEEMKKLFGHAEGYCQSSRTLCSRVALHGLGGAGKTQIALDYCYRFQKTFADASVFWVHASSVERFRDAFRDIAQKCKIPNKDSGTSDILLLVKKWLEDKQRNRWLLVIDNADDTQVFFPTNSVHITNTTDSGVGRFIPDCAHGSILITTRNKQAAVDLASTSLVEVGNMTERETDSLLHSLLKDVKGSAEELSQLSSQLEYLPLALAQAASFILKNSISVGDYLNLLGSSNSSLIYRLSEPFQAFGRDSESPHALTATWIVSFEQIRKQCLLASDLLSVMSLFDFQGIPEDFVRGYCREMLRSSCGSCNGPDGHNGIESVADTDFEGGVTKALGVLQAFSFISKTDEGSYNMHRLVQLTTRKWLIDDESLPTFSKTALKIVSSFFPEGDHQNRELCREYLPHARAVLEHPGAKQKGVRAKWAYLSQQVARFLRYEGQLQDAEFYQKRAVTLMIEIFGDDNPYTLSSKSDLSHIYRRQGRLDEAVEMISEVLKANERRRGPDHRSSLSNKHSLARLFKHQGRFEEAEKLHLQTLERRRKTLGAEHADTLSSLHELATVYKWTDRPKTSELLNKQVLEVRKRVLGEENICTLVTMSNLAIDCMDQGRLDEAEQLAERVLDIKARVFGEKHPRTISASHLLHETQGRHEESTGLPSHGLETEREMLGDSNQQGLEMMDNFVFTLETRGQLEDAVRLVQESVDNSLQTPDRQDERL